MGSDKLEKRLRICVDSMTESQVRAAACVSERKPHEQARWFLKFGIRKYHEEQSKFSNDRIT